MEELRSALRPAQIEPEEEDGLRAVVIDPLLEQARHDRASDVVQIPHVTDGGKPFLLTLDMAGGAIRSIDADHDPDLSSRVFEAYLEYRMWGKVQLRRIPDEG